MVTYSELEKKINQDYRKQLKKRLLQVAKELRITELSATNVNNIKTKIQWESALNKIQKNFVDRAERLPKSKKNIPAVKELIRKLKPMWK